MRATALVPTGAVLAFFSAAAPAQIPYAFGNPTAEEQLYIELINRARANPAAEGQRLAGTTDPSVLSAYSFFGVDLAMMQAEFNALPAQPPLAPNEALTNAARGHTDWLFANKQQTHVQSNPTKTLADRLNEAGYPYSNAGENVYSYANSVWYGHAGFQVDWGDGGTGGMQAGRGHRMSIHSGTFQEIGVGVVIGTNTPVGPQLVTQDFGRRSGMMPRGTGVAYYDLNGNNFYDLGEGIAGLTVSVDGSDYNCTTAQGGGWVVPTPSATATRAVTFSGLNINQSLQVPFVEAENTKADLKLTYVPPTFTSPAIAQAGVPHTVRFTEVGGATSYRHTRWKNPAAAAENCESTTNIGSSTTGAYSILNTSVKSQGASSFHLQNTTGTSQWIELSPLYRGGNNPTLTFQSRLRRATTSEFFRVQIKEEDSATWQDGYFQFGTNGPGETSFTLRSANLSSFANKLFRVRFILSFSSGSYHPSGSDLGWHIDQIQFGDVSAPHDKTEEILASDSTSFTPEEEPYIISVAPIISGRDFPATQQLLAVEPPPAPTYGSWASAIETAAGLPAGTLADPDGDHDLDGLANLVEYAFGTSPVIPHEPSPRLPAIQPSTTHFVVRYQKDTALADITITPQAGDLTGTWSGPGQPGAPSGFTDSLISSDAGIETRETSLPLNPATRGFVRMKVTRP